MSGVSLAGSWDRAAFARISDWLLIAVAVSLPWSTSATGILGALWLIALIPTLDWPEVRRAVLTPAGGLPVLLFLLGLAGTAWADVSWAERWNGLESFFKLLAIPLLFAQFLRSERGLWVFGGYAAACVALLLASAIFAHWQDVPFLVRHDPGVPVKNAATQSGEFLTCIFGFLFLALEAFRRREWLWSFGVALLIVAMLVNIFYVATGRTALAIMPILLVLFALKKLNYRGVLVLFAGAALLSGLAWYTSPYLRARTMELWANAIHYEASDEQNSVGERIEFAKRSLGFVQEAPILGHGTGSIHALFEKAAAGKTGAAGSATTNPHNQTFAVAIQLGVVGALVLWAMWIAHLMLFRGDGLAGWIGLVVVVQNVVGSLFNSHLFDFTQGWVYVVGVGVAGGMALKQRAAKGSGGAAP